MSTCTSLLARVAEPANLQRAWARYARARGLWLPGQPMTCVARAPVGPMLALAEDIRCGRYLPAPPHVVPVLLGNGKRRDLHVYALRDRVAQRALLQVVQARTEPHMPGSVHGYRPGRGVATALRAAQQLVDGGCAWVGDADILKCFDSIPRQGVLAQAARRLGDVDAAPVLARFMGWGPVQFAAGRTGLAQGSVLGPWLCNMYLWQLDDAVAAAGHRMVRYADDFLLLTPTQRACAAAMAETAALLQRLGLKLHPDKTCMRHAVEPLAFLGKALSVTPLLRLWRPAPTVAAGNLETACC